MSWITPQPHIPLLFASRTSWRITPLYTPLRSLSCPHGSGPRACSSLVHPLLWSLRLKIQMVLLPPPLSPQGISSASGPTSWSGAGNNPLPSIDLGYWPSLVLHRGVHQPQLLLQQFRPLTRKPAPQGLALHYPVLLARSTTSPPKLRPLPKVPWPVKRPGLLLVSKGFFRVFQRSCQCELSPWLSPPSLPHASLIFITGIFLPSPSVFSWSPGICAGCAPRHSTPGL